MVLSIMCLIAQNPPCTSRKAFIERVQDQVAQCLIAVPGAQGWERLLASLELPD
jgi:hypothetical protein